MFAILERSPVIEITFGFSVIFAIEYDFKVMKIVNRSSIIFLFVISFYNGFAQVLPDSIQAYTKGIENFRKGKNIKLMYDEATPLTPAQHKNFKGLNYFDPDINYAVVGQLEKSGEPDTIKMRTSTERSPEYIAYGIVKFTIFGNDYKLNVYQSKKMLEVNPADSTLFVPFRDATSGGETYGGGRYIDLAVPVSGKFVILDFNKAYNPYCAYNPKYSCVIPPEENRLAIPIKAGEKIFEEH